MLTFKNVVKITLIIAAFNGCMKVSKKNAEKNIEQLPQQEQAPTANSQLQKPPAENDPKQLPVEPLQEEDIFDYNVDSEGVRFRFPSDWPNEIFIDVSFENQISTFQLKDQKKWSIKLSSSQSKYSFEFKSSFDKRNSLLKRVDVLPEIDLEVSGIYNLEQNLNLTNQIDRIYFRNLFLKKKSKLLLGSYSGQVIIRNLISEFANIQSFVHEQKATLNTAGRSGGLVEFVIENGVGQLQIQSLGENGGDGSRGPDADASIKGDKGPDGDFAEFVQPAFDLSNYIRFSWECVKPPGNGQTGGIGKKGFMGYPGQNGGNSGFYFIKKIPAELKIISTSKAGRGGNGGPGGPGGQGGDGGDGGDGGFLDLVRGKDKKSKEEAMKLKSNPMSGMYISVCAPAKNGQSGPTGVSGDRGDDGLDGNNEGLGAGQN